MLKSTFSNITLLASNKNTLHTLPLPLHCLKGASPTHTFCNNQAIKILHNDNYTKEANFFSFFSSQLDEGVNWADKGFRSFYHFYDAESGSGKWHWSSATIMCEIYVNKALKLWKNKMYGKAMFYLGAATHLVQDMCVPHHACCVFMDGHYSFEEWAKKYRYNYSVNNGGLYLETKSSGEWIHSNASFSAKYYPYVQANSSEEDYHLSTSTLLPRAQRSTSGFWLWFYNLATNSK